MSSGCVKSSSLERMTKDLARDPALFDSVQGLPWKLTPAAEPGMRHEDVPIRVGVRSSAVPSADLPRAVGRAADAGPRKVYIRRHAELQRYGYTEGCLGCTAAVVGTTSAGHNEECRKRIE